MEAIQFGVVQELVKIFFTHNTEDVVELSFSLLTSESPKFNYVCQF